MRFLRKQDETVDFSTSIPFIAVHIAALAVFLVGFSWTALAVCLSLYVIRMFGITAGYHRYFSHRSYKTSRFFQFVLGFIGAASAQKGPLWWSAHHRHHHRHSDTEEDIHSPRLRGLWWAHVGWVLCKKYDATDFKAVRDLTSYPELRFLDKYFHLPPFILAVLTYFLGSFLGKYFPGLHTNGQQMLIWGFFLSTVLLYHGTFCINSFTHCFGKKRFNTTDDSKNCLWLALITLGEGWHNNHHYYPGSEQQGFYWWEIDISHYVLKVLSWFGIVWDLRVPPSSVYKEAELQAAKA